ncbi:uncharacterized protein si:ch211-236l14.1 isoform X2 [Triplophysa dalaica]|uniref:uncharacterized protein si:ch211-236l14.1 isoform X2 n=1 Tax=Triplophysa dalaica TaxID=1582913 RepID=UPI0024DF4D0F|nr:uncharacterized protein si:ch211-236l14.1 isoform X2 [Triplophysa dalaica]
MCIMSRVCVLRCETKSVLFQLPKQERLREKWLQFIFQRIPKEYNPRVVLCARHFTDDCFDNLGAFTAGYVKRLSLRVGEIPTLFGPFSSTESRPSTSQQTIGSQQITSLGQSAEVGCHSDLPHNVSVATQTDELEKTSVGTQLSIGTLKEKHHRSKASQAAACCGSVGTVTASMSYDMQFSSTPVKATEYRPHKRPRLMLEEEEEKEVEEESATQFQSEPHDSTFNPVESELSGKSDVQQRRMGTYVAFTQLCPKCTYYRKWQSQPLVGCTPIGNLLLSAATYFTGGSFFRLQKICNAMKLQVFHYYTFRRHCRNFLEPAIVHRWRSEQQNNFQKLRQEERIALSGDMRADSPGHSAKYGSYSVMHTESNTVLDLQLVLSNEVGGSSHMEKEGLKRCLDLVEKNSLSVDYIVTDRHPQIQKYLRERRITQFYDVWHFEKGLSKKLVKLAKNKDCGLLKKWLHSIRNHVYWCATSSTSGPEKVAKWMSLLNHLQNVHIHDNSIFPRCAHPVRISRSPKKWFQPGSVALRKVEKVLFNTRVIKDMEKLSHHFQTSSLEAFHSLILRFTPKNVSFPFIGMLCRQYLAVLHYNENANRTQATTAAGQPRYNLELPKSKNGEFIARPIKTEPTYHYVQELLGLVFEEVIIDPTPFVEELNNIPVPPDLTQDYDRPSKDEAIAHHVSRFTPKVVESQHTDQSDLETPAVSGLQHRME